jgi:hypothetical protein
LQFAAIPTAARLSSAALTGTNWQAITGLGSRVLDPKYDPHLHEAIETLVEQGDLDKGAPAYGVALAAIANGYDGLTRAQKGLFDRVIAPALAALAASRKADLPSAGEAPSHPADSNAWKPIREAPSDRDVQLGIRDRNGISPLAFACRRIGGSWIQSENGKPLSFRPTHWREWLHGAVDPGANSEAGEIT